MAVAARAVATMAAAGALALGGDGGGRGILEAESSEGGTVLHLQASGGSVGRGAVDKLMEEGAGEGEGGDCCCCCKFNSRGHGLPSLSLKPLSLMPTTMTTTMATTRARSQGGVRDNE